MSEESEQSADENPVAEKPRNDRTGHVPETDCAEGERADGLLTTGEMARLSGSTCRTVRFYEEAELLNPVTRSDGGHRLFQPGELEKLQLILDLREAGLSLNDIKDLFALKSGCANAKEASGRMVTVLERQISAMQDKINTLRRLREELSSTLCVIADCRTCECEEPRFPKQCPECDVLQQPDLPRALRLLWNR